MIKNITKLEITVKEKIYTLFCDIDAPIDHIKEAIFQLGKLVGQVEDRIAATATEVKPATPEPIPVVIPSVEVPQG